MNESLSIIKEAYINPEMEEIVIASRGTFLDDISKPGGEVTPLDPNEE